MKAFVRIDSVDQEVSMEDVPIPKYQSNEVLIKVEAFGVGIHDRYFIPSDAKFPYVIGLEGTGVIQEIGSEFTNFKVDDRVIFTTVMQANGGSWAEYAVANQDVLISLPANLTFAQGATVPIAGKTALECMRELDIKEGESLFIAGASGAIGTLVIQLAHAKGVRISASASAKNQDYMKTLGADQTVDYSDPDWINKVKNWSDGGVDKVLAIQPDTEIKSIQVVKDGGLLITVSGYNSSISSQRGIDIRQMGHELFTTTELKELVNSISIGEINIVIEKEFPFDQALEALLKTETRKARGKVVVNVN
ncbi:MAG TPA: NADP-dependent oxidoreductase [Chitinophagales bacterium]|nr:NADP-dependent oxidoreductase [Chitinophagales bacterium]